MATTTTPRNDVKIVPRWAWKFQGFGTLVFGGLIIGSLLVTDPSKLWFFGPIPQLLYLVGIFATVLFCVRPPGVILRENEMIVRQFGPSRHVERQNVREVLFELPKRVIGGEMPNSSRRQVEVVIWEDGKEVVIPMFWCYRWLGLMTIAEAEATKATVDGWTGRTGTN